MSTVVNTGGIALYVCNSDSYCHFNKCDLVFRKGYNTQVTLLFGELESSCVAEFHLLIFSCFSWFLISWFFICYVSHKWLFRRFFPPTFFHSWKVKRKKPWACQTSWTAASWSAPWRSAAEQLHNPSVLLHLLILHSSPSGIHKFPISFIALFIVWTHFCSPKVARIS